MNQTSAQPRQLTLADMGLPDDLPPQTVVSLRLAPQEQLAALHHYHGTQERLAKIEPAGPHVVPVRLSHFTAGERLALISGLVAFVNNPNL